jgi:hypothetical protein
MIGHQLTNTNESATVTKAKNFRELNTLLLPSVVTSSMSEN